MSKLLAVVMVVVGYHIKREMDIEQTRAPGLAADGSGPAFSETYFEAREKFIRAAKAIPGIELSAHPIAEGSPYTTDIAFLKRGGSEDVIVHLTGVHGVEGYAGSAIQIETLRRWAADPASVPKANVVLVHAYNPFGMATYRRWNENNVDLNRNAILSKAAFQEVLDRDSNIGGYLNFADLFNPKDAPTVIITPILMLARSVVAIAQHGLVSVKRAMVGAQYYDEKGIFFGGKELQPSHVNFYNFIKKNKLDELKGKVRMIDVHTGLGPKGVDTLLVTDEAEMKACEKFVVIDAKVDPQTRFECFDGKCSGQSQAGDGYELTRGVTQTFFGEIFPAAVARGDYVSATQEFGTLHSVFVGQALVLENQAYHNAKEEARAYWAQYTKDAFYVRTPEWRAKVVRRGTTLLDQFVKF